MSNSTTAHGAAEPHEGNDRDRMPATPEPSTAVTRALTESIDTVKQLLAAGLLDASALGLDGHVDGDVR